MYSCLIKNPYFNLVSSHVPGSPKMPDSRDPPHNASSVSVSVQRGKFRDPQRTHRAPAPSRKLARIQKPRRLHSRGWYSSEGSTERTELAVFNPRLM